MALPRVLCRVRLFVNKDFSTFSSKYSCFAYSSLVKNSVRIHISKPNKRHFSKTLIVTDDHAAKGEKNKKKSSSSSSSDDSDSDGEDEVKVDYHNGLPRITVPLPSRKEMCSFTLKPISNTVGEFLEMLKKEDKGIDRAVCKYMNGTRIASSNSIETLLDDNFKLVINDNSYTVCTPTPQRLTGEEIQNLNNIKHLINRLYQALHVEEHQLTKEKELLRQLEAVKAEMEPLDNPQNTPQSVNQQKSLLQMRNEIELVAHKKSDWLAWVGLGLMSVQFGILARLTWWEYSWDIMEPVTYFVTYGTAMACYTYFLLTKQEYVLADVRDRQHLLIMHKKAKKMGIDLNHYNMLKEELHNLEYKLRKLRNPLKLHLPPKVTNTLGKSSSSVTGQEGQNEAQKEGQAATSETDQTVSVFKKMQDTLKKS